MFYSDTDQLYYHDEYTPSYNFSNANEKQIKYSRTIWSFKNGDNGVISNFARILASDVQTIATEERVYSNNIALVAVPTSKAGKRSSVQRCIKEACDMLQASEHPKNYLDWSNCLIRNTNVQTAHLADLGCRPTYTDHINSLSCSVDRISRHYVYIILIDDIFTTGTSINAYREILLNNGAYTEYIANYVFGKTVH